jgi:hypothetical protein
LDYNQDICFYSKSPNVSSKGGYMRSRLFSFFSVILLVVSFSGVSSPVRATAAGAVPTRGKSLTLADLPTAAQNSILAALTKDASTQWIQEAKLTSSDIAPNELGQSVAMNGDVVVVGAWNATVGSNHAQGAAYVFVKPVGGWGGLQTEVARLTASSGHAWDELGNAVAIDGDTIVVGARSALIGGAYTGAAYVFVRPGASWVSATENARLTASDASNYGDFGASVGISVDTIVVGAKHAGYIFIKPGDWSGNLTQTAKLTASDGASDDFMGVSSGISGNTVVVGAPGANIGGNVGQGAAYVFVRPGGGWNDMTQTAKLTASDGNANDALGMSAAIEGDTIVVGAQFNNAARGAAYVFVAPGNSWSDMTQSARLTASDGAAIDYLGSAVGISGNRIVSGAYKAKNGGVSIGAVYVFNKPAGGWSGSLNENARITSSDGAMNDQFGWSVGISGNTIVAGAPMAAIQGGGMGAAYVFQPGTQLFFYLPAIMKSAAGH